LEECLAVQVMIFTLSAAPMRYPSQTKLLRKLEWEFRAIC